MYDLEQLDTYNNHRLWLSSEPIRSKEFEFYVIEHFWGLLGEEFKALLHPQAVASAEDYYDTLQNEWSLFLWLVLSEDRLEILIRAFVDSNRDAFEEWVLG